MSVQDAAMPGLENGLGRTPASWIDGRFDENVVTIGITKFAQDALGEIVYVELPEEGQKLSQGQTFGVVESVKAVSDLYAPVSGTVIEVNTALTENPTILNDDPINNGWMIRIEMDTEKELASLMRAPDYKKLIQAN